MCVSDDLCVLSTEFSRTAIRYDFNAMFRALAERDEADAVIVSTEEGFSPLGASREFFERDLGIPYDAEIRQLARWNQDENEKVSIVALQSRNAQGLLRGVLLTPGENCLSYAPFASTSHAYSPKPHRDYYYNVSYEAIAFLCQEWGARKIAISHLSASGRFHEDIATCHVEALMHFCNEHPDLAPESFTFCGCCIEPNQLAGAQRLVEADEVAPHRQIRTSARVQGPAKIIILEWSASQSN